MGKYDGTPEERARLHVHVRTFPRERSDGMVVGIDEVEYARNIFPAPPWVRRSGRWPHEVWLEDAVIYYRALKAWAETEFASPDEPPAPGPVAPFAFPDALDATPEEQRETDAFLDGAMGPES